MASKKRGQNEGSVFERKDGRWCGLISLGWDGGRRKRKYFYGATAAEVQEQLLKARSDHSKRLPVSPETQTVGQFLNRWLNDSVKPGVRPRTYESYELTVRLHLEPELRKIRLERLTPEHVQALLNRKSREGKLSPRSVSYIRAVLRRALNKALRWGLIARNPATLVDPPRSVRREIAPLSAEQARALLETAKGDRIEAFYTVALLLGLRRGEVLGLSWRDVDFDRRTLHVRQTIQRLAHKLTDGKGGLVPAEPKTDKSRRTLSLPDGVIRALKAHRARQATERLAAGTAWRDSDLIFTSPSGKPLDPKGVHRDFKRLLAKAELPMATRLHDLRHSAASLLLAQGVPLRTIMELLGHSSLAMTANVYAHVAPAALRDIADRMDVIFANQRSGSSSES
jgi:integrase